MRHVRRMDDHSGMFRMPGLSDDPTTVEDVIAKDVEGEPDPVLVVLDDYDRETSMVPPCKNCQFAIMPTGESRHVKCKAGQTKVYEINTCDTIDPSDHGWPDREDQIVRPATSAQMAHGHHGRFIKTMTPYVHATGDNPTVRATITDHIGILRDEMDRFEADAAEKNLSETEIRDGMKAITDEISERCMSAIEKIANINKNDIDDIARHVRRLMGSEDALDQEVTDVSDIEHASKEILDRMFGMSSEGRVHMRSSHSREVEFRYWNKPSKHMLVDEKWMIDIHLRGTPTRNGFHSGYVKARRTIKELPIPKVKFRPHDDIGRVTTGLITIPVKNYVVCNIARSGHAAMNDMKGAASVLKKVRQNKELAYALSHGIGAKNRASAILHPSIRSSMVLEVLLEFGGIDQKTYQNGRLRLKYLKSKGW